MSIWRNNLEPDAMSAIVNCLCPECGGVIELETNRLECLRCGKHWRQVWERMSPQPFCPVERRRKFIGTKRFGMREKIASLTSKSHFLLPRAPEPFLRWSAAAPGRKGAFEQSGAAMKLSKTLSVLEPLKPKIDVIDGLYNKATTRSGHSSRADRRPSVRRAHSKRGDR
jgi:hypothetical protein